MSKRKVTFIIPMFDDRGDHNFIEVSKAINTNQPL